MSREKRPVYFRFFNEVCDMFAFLDEESAGRVILAACDYFQTKTEPEGFNKGETRIFNRLKQDIDTSFENYEKAVEAGKRGAAKRYGE